MWPWDFYMRHYLCMSLHACVMLLRKPERTARTWRWKLKVIQLSLLWIMMNQKRTQMLKGFGEGFWPLSWQQMECEKWSIITCVNIISHFQHVHLKIIKVMTLGYGLLLYSCNRLAQLNMHLVNLLKSKRNTSQEKLLKSISKVNTTI